MGDAADDLYEAEMNGWLADDLFDEGVVIPGQHVLRDGSPVETEKALLWERKEDGQHYWIPKSQLIKEEPDHIIITSWLADRRGWSDPNEEEEIPF